MNVCVTFMANSSPLSYMPLDDDDGVDDTLPAPKREYGVPCDMDSPTMRRATHVMYVWFKCTREASVLGKWLFPSSRSDTRWHTLFVPAVLFVSHGTSQVTVTRYLAFLTATTFTSTCVV